MDSFNAMDFTKLDQATAATRQKSCNACVRGKRKCDKKMPRCTRCAAKGLDCLYKKLPSESSSPSNTTGGAATNSSSVALDGACSISDVPEFDMGFDIESLGTETSPESMQPDPVGLHQLDPALDFNIADLMAGSTSGASDFWNLHTFADAAKMDMPPVPIVPVRQPVRDLAAYNNDTECMSIDPLAVHDPRTSVGFLTRELTSMHAVFAQTRELPFMHSRLWASSRMPQTILSAFAASSAYAGRTPENRAWVLKIVADAARDVHREGERQGLGAAEKLARVQALVVLAMIRVFDGDIGSRAAVEREMGVLISWVHELAALKDELEGGVDPQLSASRERPPKSWESWMLLESTRRTVIMGYSFICLFTVLKAEEPPCDLWEGTKCFTASRHLWEAQSAVEFYRAWREKPQFCIDIMDFKEFWMYARPEDLDEFTRLLLTTHVGPDAIEQFVSGEMSIPVPSMTV